MIGQAEKQYWQGGRVYGYKLVPVLDPTRTDPYGNRTASGRAWNMDPEQAKWVRWIFERYAEGQSPIKIVTELNRLRGVPARGRVSVGTIRARRAGARWPCTES